MRLTKYSELVQLKLNITRFYEVKYALGFGGGIYPHRRRNDGAYQRSVPKERTYWNAPPREDNPNPPERTTSLDPLTRNPHLLKRESREFDKYEEITVVGII